MSDVGVVEECVDEAVQVAIGGQELRLETGVERHQLGDDLEADLSAMAADPIVQQWWTLTDAMQDPYPEREPGTWWLTLPEIFHTGD